MRYFAGLVAASTSDLHCLVAASAADLHFVQVRLLLG